MIAELAERGVDRDGAAEVLAAGQIESRLLEPPEDSDTIRNAVGFITAIVTFMMIQIYGSFVAMGVIEEKSSRVIEILLAHLRPRDLLAGKIIGIGVLALAQTVILIGGLIAALSVTNDITIPADAWLAVPVAAVWLVLGFTFYASLLAAAGSLVSRTEDAQQVMLPVIAPLLVGYFVGVTASGSSDSILVVVLSHLPFTSPTVMPMRVAQGGVPSWEIGLSVVLLFGGIVAMLRVAGRIYEYSLLRTGSRVAWRDAFGSLTTRSR